MSKSVRIRRLEKLSQRQREALMSRAESNLNPFIKRVKPIIGEVRKDGDRALVKFAKKFDGAVVDVNGIQATKSEIREAYKKLNPEFVEVLKYASQNIRAFHRRQTPKNWSMEVRPGIKVGEHYQPIESVACYNPRGKGAFPSVTLMTVIPAVVAKVPEIIVLTPPNQDGDVDPATLVAADIAGCKKIYKAGGAQAIAAAAFGTESIPKCVKVEGPGSPWVAAAKIVLANRIDPGMPAGPSESIILADSSVDTSVVALDTIIESEHGSDSSVFLVTTSKKVAEEAAKKIPQYWKKMSKERAGYSRAVLGGNSGGIVVVGNMRQAYDFINEYAPEHLQILTKNPKRHIRHIKNAAEILLGQNTPGSVANYMMGPNCVLPTSGAAKTRSPLGVRNFLRSFSVGEMTQRGLKETGPKTEIFAAYEGFDAHANAIKFRQKR